jgi:hypothetical protein
MVVLTIKYFKWMLHWNICGDVLQLLDVCKNYVSGPLALIINLKSILMNIWN